MTSKVVKCQVAFADPAKQYTTSLTGRYVKLPLKRGVPQFLHIEFKKSEWHVSNALEKKIVKSIQITFDRKDPNKLEFSLNGLRETISISAQVTTGNSGLFHLDQLPDGTWRVTYSRNFLPLEFGEDLSKLSEILITFNE